ncbi:MAG: hypothetical protein DRN53_00585 [Thermoprotei archaeon]|nr:MAG: hypothetical protein DRN53_00585 [Thermoprotei archaeon]
MLDEVRIRWLLRSPGRRATLTEIVKERVITTSELVKRTKLKRQTIIQYLREFEEVGLIELRKEQKPWIAVISNDIIEHPMIMSILSTERVPTIRKKLVFTHSWDDFPECLIEKRKIMSISFIWGSKELVEANIRDALLVPEIVRELLLFSLEKGLKPDNLIVRSLLDIQALRERNVLLDNLLVIGSGLVNKLTVELQRIYDLPIGFKPIGGRDLYSSITKTAYLSGDEIGKDSGVLALLPNPWQKGKVVILVAGVHASGTQAGLMAILSHLRAKRGFKTSPITDHPIANIPIRVVRAKRSTRSWDYGRIEGFEFLE